YFACSTIFCLLCCLILFNSSSSHYFYTLSLHDALPICLILSLAKDRNITIFVSSHILSEIEQLATHMGIIHEGRLLEEIAFDKLRERNRNYLEFQVSDDNKAIMLLESQFGISDYEV